MNDSKPSRKDLEKDLYNVISLLKNSDECYRFFSDLCTPKEIKDMADRWHVAQFLNEGKLSYREIHAKTGVSVTTIGRVARFLTQENYKGYQMMLKRKG